MSKLSVGLTAAVALLTSPAELHANDEDTLHLKAKGEWQLRAMDDRCRMSRTFGDGDDRTTLWIDKGGPGPAVNLTLIGKPVRYPFGANIEAGFLPGDMLDRNYITSTSSKGRPVLVMFGVQPLPLRRPPPNVSLEDSIAEEETVDISEGSLSIPTDQQEFAGQLNAINELRLAKALREPVSLELEGFVPMMAELMRCTSELTERLAENSRQSIEAKRSVKPEGAGNWAKKIQANYPHHLVRAGEESTVGVRLTVNTLGKASFCEVIEYSGPASFNDTACLLMLRHSRFEPAHNAEGNAVPAFYTTRIIYRLNK